MCADWFKIMFLYLNKNAELAQAIDHIKKVVETLACQLVLPQHF